MKKHLLSLFAVVVAIATVAFTPAPASRAVTDHWYFTGDEMDNPEDENLYEPLTGQDDGCPGNSEVNCVVIAPEKMDGRNPLGIPDLSGSYTVDSVKP